MSNDLVALSTAWMKFLPRDAKSSSFRFVVTRNGAPLQCRLKIAFHYYIEVFRSGYAGDSLHEVLRSFIDGSDPFPPHPDAVFDPRSLKVEKLAPGYSRPDALAKLSAILSAAFPGATSKAPTKSGPKKTSSKKKSSSKKLPAKKPSSKPRAAVKAAKRGTKTRRATSGRAR